MSIGPYLCLSMPKVWRDVAELAQKPAFGDQECGASMRAALDYQLKRDVGKEALMAFWDTLCQTAQEDFSMDQICAKLDTMRDDYPPSGFMDSIVEQTQVALSEGKTGERAFIEGMTRAAQDHAASYARAIEEWCYRALQNSKGLRQASKVRRNLKRASQTESMRSFGSEVAMGMRGKAISAKPRKAAATMLVQQRSDGGSVEPL